MVTSINVQFGVGKEELSFTRDEVQYIENICANLEIVINSRAFESEIKNYSFRNGLGIRRKKFRMNNGFGRARIYEMIISGKDNYEESSDTLDLALYPYINEIVYHAYTSPSMKKIYINTVYLKSCMNLDSRKGNANFLGTLLHEYMHNLGFNHKGNKPSNYNNSTVPYAIGKIAKKIYLNSKQ